MAKSIAKRKKSIKNTIAKVVRKVGKARVAAKPAVARSGRVTPLAKRAKVRSASTPTRTNFIPSARYTAPDVTAREKAYLWPRIWHIVCREEEIPEIGDFVTYEIFEESIVVVRVAADEVKAYYNVCQHRGRRILDKPSGRLQRFHCRFHGWQWSLEGSLAHQFSAEDWKNCEGFDPARLNLKPVRLDRWGGWFWINMDLEAQPLRDWLGKTLVDTLKPFEFEGLRRAWHEVIIAPVNWKVVVEAFNEGYHSGSTHSFWLDYKQMSAPAHVHGNHAMYFTNFNSLPRAKREDGTWAQTTSLQEMLYYQSKEINETLFALVPDPMMRAITRLRDETPPDMPPEQLFARFWDLHKEELQATGAHWPEKLTLEDVGKAGTSWHIFPNTIVLPAVDGVLWYRMRPYGDDPHRCIFDIWGLQRYAPGKEPEVKTHVTEGFEAFRGRNPFLEQDFDNMFAVDRGMYSRGWAGAETNPVQEVTIAHFHRMLDRFTQAPAPRSKPRLAKR